MSKNPSAEPSRQFKKLVQEYRRLINLKEPSDTEQRRIEAILELAVYDTELDDWLSHIDEQMTIEIRSIEEDSNFVNKNQMSILNNKEHPKNLGNIVVFPLLKTS